MPPRLRPADPAAVQPALARFKSGTASDTDLRLLAKHLAAVLIRDAPGGAVELRVPPYLAVQAVGGTTHKRGTPPAVVEVDPVTWVALGIGDLAWVDAHAQGRLTASGERSDLSAYLPLLR